MTHQQPIPFPPSPEDDWPEAADIQSRCRFLAPNSAVGSIAELVLRGRGRRPGDLSPLFTSLAGASRYTDNEQALAAWALGRAHLEAQERDAAIGMLQGALRKARSLGPLGSIARGLTWAGATGVAIVGLIVLIAFVMGSGPAARDVGDIVMAVAFATGLCAPIAVVLSILADARGQREGARSAAAEALGRLHAVEATGALATALFDRSARVRHGAAIALHELLPTVTPDHFGVMGRDDIAALARALAHPDQFLVYKALDALAHVGTGVAVPAVDNLSRSAVTPRLRERASEVLAVLQSRGRQEQDGRTLGRAVITPQPTDALLRPARNAVGDEEQLLRPSGE